MYGWTGKVLRVNLTQGRCSVEDLPPTIAKDFIGGQGTGTKFLLDEIDPKVDPFSPENKLVFATGPLTGTRAICSGRFEVVCKSPLTDAIAYANCGGFFGPELKFAGYDLIIFEGKASAPVYLSIKDDKVEILPAQHLWGKNTIETQDLIRSELEDKRTRIACIGPAGEKLVRFASIMHELGRAAARDGVGAVMGAKNLKAVAVRGTKKVSIAHDGDFKKAVADIMKKIRASEIATKIFPERGTVAVLGAVNRLGVFPTRNFQEGYFEGAGNINAKAVATTVFVKKKACYACPLACTRLSKVTDPEFAGEGEGPEYETLAMLGADCGIDHLSAITKANYICNELGMDTISVGGTIACAMELYEKGYLPLKDVGMELNFGNYRALVELVTKIGLRQGFGDLLAEGSYRLAERYGHPEIAMHVKKQEMPAWQVQGVQGMGLEFATSNRGACHMRAQIFSFEAFGNVGWVPPQKLDPFVTEGKAYWVKTFQDFHEALDASGLCLFICQVPLGVEDVLSMLETATGAGYTRESMLLVGERMWNAERLFNLRAGLTGKDDTLPRRILEEPMPSGPAKGQVCRLNEMLPEYYQLRGWDKNGVPTPKKLAELGLQ